MIQLKMSGRAGNQLFQYAMIRAYMKKNNIKEKLYISMEHIEKFRKKNDESFKDYLKDFNVIDYITLDKTRTSIKQFILEILYKVHFKIKLLELRIKQKKWSKEDWNIEKKRWKKILNKNGIYYYFRNDFDFEECNIKNKIFYGSFESAKFFDDIKETLFDELTPKQEKLKKNHALYEIIEKSNSVCVSIRRGDFLNLTNVNSFYVCTPEYFDKAIQIIKEKIDNPKFIVFSDDIEWCKNNMNFPAGTVYETGTDPVWEKLRLMYSCKNFILSNSTFSWWAQYLSRNKDKIVVAPSIWSKNNYCEDIYQDSWIKVEI